MKISELGGEFALINRITRKSKALVGVGDDAAVISKKNGICSLITTDMLCEGDHFTLGWSTPQQIGAKAMEVNVSDIAAMGGLPTHAVVSLSLTDDVTVEFMDQLYAGMYSVCDEYGFDIVGGDTTRGKSMIINVALLGEVEEKMLSLRSDAEVGDLICASGDLGKSKAGLELLRAKVEGDVSAHISPKCRLKEARTIAKHCNAMIDISDGLASEVNHICEMSGVGAVVYREKIPLSNTTIESAKKLAQDPYEWALSGGEDFELVFTIPPERLKKINVGCLVTVVGEIVKAEEGSTLVSSGVRKPLAGGYNHFD